MYDTNICSLLSSTRYFVSHVTSSPNRELMKKKNNERHEKSFVLHFYLSYAFLSSTAYELLYSQSKSNERYLNISVSNAHITFSWMHVVITENRIIIQAKLLY